MGLSKWSRTPLAAVAVGSVLALAPVVAPEAGAAEERPSDQQIMDALRDEWGRANFRETRIGEWQTLATWERAEQFVFAPGRDELTGRPVAESGLAPLRLEVFGRLARNQTQFEVTETAGHADGTETKNYFPIFRGTPRSMVFFNAAGIPGLPAGEVQESCRDLRKADRHFLLCRMIGSDGSIRYQVKVAQGSPTEGLPAVNEVLCAFRDQWGGELLPPERGNGVAAGVGLAALRSVPVPGRRQRVHQRPDRRRSGRVAALHSVDDAPHRKRQGGVPGAQRGHPGGRHHP